MGRGVDTGLVAWLFLGSAIALAVAGLVLIWYSARMVRSEITKRVNLARDLPARPRARAAPTPAEMAFVRHEDSELSQQQQRSVVRIAAKFGVPASRATQALLISRLAAIALVALLTYFVIGGASAFAASGSLRLLVSLGFGLAGWFIPAMLISSEVQHRAKAIVAGLPDALELMVICAEAGLSFQDAIDRIAGELGRSHPALAEELALTSADLRILPSRDVALKNLAERVNMPSIRTVVTTLTQTLRYGTPLAQALRAVAAELRNDSLMQLEERANQLPALMTIPMMIFIMPTIFLVIGGPAVLRVIDTIRTFHH